MVELRNPMNRGGVEADSRSWTCTLPVHASTGLLIAIPFVHASIMGAAGFGFLLDDWYTLRNAHFDGAFSAAGGDQLLARPGAWLVYGIVFGVLGEMPVLILALLAAIRSATAVALRHLLRQFIPDSVSVAASVAWVVLPLTSSLEFWASGSNIALALLTSILACLALSRSLRRGQAGVLSCGLLAASALLYEAVVPAAAIGIVAIAFRRRGRDVRAVVAATVFPLVSLGSASLWVLLNWNPAKEPARTLTDLTPAYGAHLGWGILGFGPVADVAAAVLFGCLLWSIGTLVAPNVLAPAGLGPRMVVAGAAVVLVSLLPFSFYAYEPLGVGDRVNVTASVGTAMLWTGAARMLWERWRSAALVAGGLVVVAATAVRLEMVTAYSWAAEEADRIVASVPCSPVTPPIIAGPRPDVRSNVTSFLDAEDHLEPAVQMRLDDPEIEVVVIGDPAELARAGGADISLTDPVGCDDGLGGP